MSSLLEQAFGTANVDLYDDVLHVSKTCTPAQLRKAYYKQALQFHPDKNPNDDMAKRKFQAVSWAYNLLKDPSRRQDYDTDGILPHDDDDGDDDDDNNDKTSVKVWKDYFDLIFGKLSTNDIDAFAMKYKMSDEEEKDVLEHYVKYHGNLTKMLEYVMLSEERDVPRWVEDYIRPAIATGRVEDYGPTLNKTLKQVQKKLEQKSSKGKSKNGAPNDGQDDPDETETEGSDDNDTKDKSKTAATTTTTTTTKKQKAVAKKGKPTQAKKKQRSDQDLVAAIRNKNGRGNPFASIAARYGVTAMDDDPLDDSAFAKLQAKVSKKKEKK